MFITYILRTIKLIWKLNKIWFCFSSIFMIILGMLPVATIWTTKELVNNVSTIITSENKNYTLAITLLVLQFLLLLIETIIKQFQYYIDENMRFKLTKFLTEEIAYKTFKIPYSYFDNPDFYNYTNRIKSNTGRRLLSPINNLFLIAQSLITISSLIIFLLSIHWSLAVVASITFFPALFIKSYLGKQGFELTKKTTPLLRETNYIENLLMQKDTIKEIRIFNLHTYFIQRWEKKYNKNMSYSLNFLKTKSKAEIFLDLLVALSYCGSAGIIIWLIKKSAVKIGDFVSIGQAVHSTQNALHNISANLAQLYEDVLYIYDYFHYIDSLDEDEINTDEQVPFPSVLQYGIRFENVSFSYPNNKNKILQNVSFSILPNEKIAIVGHNGSGKTTLIKCLLGLYPLTSGNIYFDNIPINKIQLHSLREHTTVMFQDFIQYHLTIRENIALGNVSEINNDEKLKNVAMQSGIHEDIQLFPNAYNTPLGRFLQEGEELSGGQWQKLAISRSLFKNGNIMILDEPTAALDPISEREIFDKFELLTNQKTTIMISHKMSAAKLADKIVVLDNGELVEFGTHEELFLKKGKYYELYTTQATLYQNKLDEVLI
ncbi:ABC transporter ATP-binding protein [Bacillus wiedmannii]|nr:ABC transporter ATP-binding protein [Bacillus wiedmannii]EJS65085.1 hypothetical protein ICW_04667 [Bacillus wiedmannii]EJV68809.1 hypothetical protein IEO_00558 [Bacillus wiedmannii]MDR4944138.1 ABC transporter ATP-binding protein [Bacillus wiedmannii]MED3314369.1 ABC transporter ATP-binding protein [Bacillus wiedmannii]OFD12052.1 putative multidrug export ATP-binding/permease protein YgaD [Bacillus wiedmannii]